MTMLLLKDHNTAEEMKKKFYAEQDKNLATRRSIIKRTYNPNSIVRPILGFCLHNQESRYLG